MRNLLPAALLLVTQQLLIAQPSVFAKDAPNVVVIMTDDMGYSDLGCFGGEIETPNLDQLAQKGLRFANFYSENMCWVSRAALLTGVYHKASMVNGAMHNRCPTMAEQLQLRGYDTRMSGKWHLAGKGYSVHPMDRGFQDYYGILGGAASFFQPSHLFRRRTNIETEPDSDPDYYLTHAITSEAERMIGEVEADHPLFLYVAYTAAHWPLHAPAKDIEHYRGRYRQGWDQLRKQRLSRMKDIGLVSQDQELSPRHPKVSAWSEERHQAWQQRRMEVYAAQVTAMDRGVGQIVKALRDSGRLENTLIFFTIDNGGCHVEYTPTRKGDYLPDRTRDGRPVRPGNLPDIMPGPEDTYQSYGYGWANASNTPYRMFKQFDHEGGIRTPMIAHWPAGIKEPGRIIRSVSHLVDILPTVMDVTARNKAISASLHSEMPADGHTLGPAFEGRPLPEERSLFFHHAKGKALRDGHWKIVAENRKAWELYDLSKDPLELNNLAEQQPERLKKLVTLWKAESKRLEEQSKLK